MNPYRLVALLPETNGDPIDVVVHHPTLGRGLMTLWPPLEKEECDDDDDTCDDCSDCVTGEIWFQPDNEDAEDILVGTIDTSAYCNCGKCLQVTPTKEVRNLIMGAYPIVGEA